MAIRITGTRAEQLERVRLLAEIGLEDKSAGSRLDRLENLLNLQQDGWEGMFDKIIKKVEKDALGALQDAQERAGEAKTALANITAKPEDRESYRQAVAERTSDLNAQIGVLDTIKQAFPEADISVPEPVRVPSGFIPAGEKAPEGVRSIGQRFGAPLITRQLADKTWGVFRVGEDTPIEGGFSSQIIADQAATQLNLGSRKKGDPAPVPLVDAPAREAELAKERGLAEEGGLGTDTLTPGQRAAIDEAAKMAAEDPTLVAKPEALSNEDIMKLLEGAIKGTEKATATAEVEPFFTQMFTRAREDFESGLSFAAQFRELALQKEETELKEALEGAAVSAAEAGLATSGIRARMEREIAEKAENISRTSRLEFEQKARTLGRSAEEQVGTRNLAAARIAELRGEPIFGLTPDVRGTVEAERETEIETRTSELERKARIRTLAGIPGAEVAIEDLVSLF